MTTPVAFSRNTTEKSFCEKYIKNDCFPWVLVLIGLVGSIWAGVCFYQSCPIVQSISVMAIGCSALIAGFVCMAIFELNKKGKRMTSSIYRSTQDNIYRRNEREMNARSLESRKSSHQSKANYSSDSDSSSSIENDGNDYLNRLRWENDLTGRVNEIVKNYPWNTDTQNISDRAVFNRMQIKESHVNYDYDKFIEEHPVSSKYYVKTMHRLRINLDIWFYASQDQIQDIQKEFEPSDCILN